MHRITPLVCGLLIVCADASYAQIRWQTNIDEARQMAAHQNRLVLLHFWSDDCPPCRIVDRKVFTRSDVVRSIHANYIPVKIHAKRSHAVAEQYKVRGWPTDVFITPDGKELKRSVSSQDPNRYIALVDAIAAHHRVNSPVPPQAQYVQSPRREAQMPTRSAPTPSQFSQRAAQFAQGQNAQVSQGPNNQARNPQGPLAQGQFTQGQNSQPQYRQPQYSQGQTAQSPVAPTGASPRNVGSRFTTPADNSAQSQIVANPYFNSSRRPTDRAGASGNNQSPPAAPTPRFSLNNQGVNNQGPPPGQTGSVGSRYSGQSSRQPASYSPPYARAATGAAGNIGGARA
ncbi:MAG: DUF255 domain-containing protein, partial [Pirellulaceae bacterium]|nr:DUF255 domain-containing protein [Pirellulaceae bacterium]